MKSRFPLPPVLVCFGMLPLSLTAAPVAIPGSFTYVQDFDTLSSTPNNTAAQTTWDDDVTIPGWHLYRAGNAANAGLYAGTGYPYWVSNGIYATTTALTPTGHFYSIGEVGETDRALGAVPITGQGEFSTLAFFHNEAAIPVFLSTVAYNAEIRHTNQNAGVVETIAVWWTKAPTEAGLLAVTTAPATVVEFPPEVSTGPSSWYISGWNRVATADFTYSNASANEKVNTSTPVNASLGSTIRINPGEYFAIRWGNINDSGADALMGIDDLRLEFTAADVAVAGVVSNVIRNDAGTPRDPADDTVGFDLTVNGTGAVSAAGWTISAPAEFAGTQGPYGIAKSFTGVPIAGFSGPGHSLQLTVEDQGNPSTSTSVAVVAPWCQLVAQAGGFTYADGGTPDDSLDDMVSYTVSADSLFTGLQYRVTDPAQSLDYGMPLVVSGVPQGGVVKYDFTDSADAACTASLQVLPPGIMGTDRTSGTALPLLSLPQSGAKTADWSVDSAARTISQSNSTQGLNVIESRILDLTNLPEVRVRATLDAITGSSGTPSSGFEAEDSFAFDLIIDGGPPVSALGSANDTDGNGLLTGTAELPLAASATKTFSFDSIVPAAASSLKLRITGNSNSNNEAYLLKNLRIEISLPEITAVTAGAATVDNRGTVDPMDDEFSGPVSITSVSTGASPGWHSNEVPPRSGLYTAANPVMFGPYPVPGGAKQITVADDLAPAATSRFLLTPPVASITVSAAANITANANGPGSADDTVSFDVTIAGNNGGPGWTAAGTSPAAGSFGVQTLTVPAGSAKLQLIVADVSYPSITRSISVNLPGPFIIGQYDAGGGTTALYTDAAAPPGPGWVFDGAARLFSMKNGAASAAGSLTPQTVTSEMVALTPGSARQFTASLIINDLTSGFEAADTFNAYLIIDGDAAAPVSLISAHDTDGSGLLTGAELCPAPAVNPTVQEFTYPLSAPIPAAATSVTLVISGINNSANETMTIRNIFFGAGAGDTDLDGMTDGYEDANGLDRLSPADRDLDLDGDGQTNYQEFLAGSAANNGRSFLQITSVVFDAAAAEAVIRWASAAGRRYQLQVTPDLSTPWVDAGNPVTASGEETQIVQPVAGMGSAGAGFVRVKVLP